MTQMMYTHLDLITKECKRWPNPGHFPSKHYRPIIQSLEIIRCVGSEEGVLFPEASRGPVAITPEHSFEPTVMSSKSAGITRIS